MTSAPIFAMRPGMSMPMPPQIEMAIEALQERFKAVEKKELDLASMSWSDIEKAVIKLLGGPFRPDQREHQEIAFGLAGILAMKLGKDSNAFWFQNRES